MVKKSVLIVDDEIDIVQALKELFEPEGWEVLTAFCGRDALNVIKSNAPNVILSDIQMPDMGGLELLEAVFKCGIDTPIILLTGYRDVQKMQRAWEACVYDFTDKPFDPNHILALVENAREFGPEYVRSARKRFRRIRKAKAA